MPRKYKRLEQKTAQQLVKEADKYFSKYVRVRDSELDEDEYIGTCITCSKTGTIAVIEDGKLRFTKGWDAGHFISRGNKVVRFADENVNLQCLTKDSNMMMYGGYSRSVKDVIAGDVVIAFDEKKYTKTVATVVANIPQVSKELFEIKLENGVMFQATGDHRVVCEVEGVKGWYFVKDIHNMLHAGTVCNIITI